jgi:hypothetical protein
MILMATKSMVTKSMAMKAMDDIDGNGMESDDNSSDVICGNNILLATYRYLTTTTLMATILLAMLSMAIRRMTSISMVMILTVYALRVDQAGLFVELPDYWESALGENSDDMTPDERRKISEAGIRVGPTFNDLIDEAKFNSIIERPSIRNESATWQHLVASSSSSMTNSAAELPVDLQEWVQSGTVTTISKSTVGVNGSSGQQHASSSATSLSTSESATTTAETV